MTKHNGRPRKRKQAHHPDQGLLEYGQDPVERWQRIRDYWRGVISSIRKEQAPIDGGHVARLREFLRAVLYLDPNGEGCTKGNAEIARVMDSSVATVGRAKADAERLGLVVIETRSNPGPTGGSIPDRIRVVIERVAELSPHAKRSSNYLNNDARQGERPATGRRGEVTDHSAEVIDHGEEVSAHREEVIDHGERTNKEIQALRTSANNKPPPPASPAESAAATHADAWSEAEGELYAAGVNQAHAAVTAARKSGATAAFVLALVAWWRDRRDGWEYPEQELYRRVRRATAEERDPASGWPKYRPGYVSPERSEERRLALRREHEQRSAATAKKASTKREREELRQAVESISPAERERILDARQPGWRRVLADSSSPVHWDRDLVALAIDSQQPRPP